MVAKYYITLLLHGTHVSRCETNNIAAAKVVLNSPYDVRSLTGQARATLSNHCYSCMGEEQYDPIQKLKQKKSPPISVTHSVKAAPFSKLSSRQRFASFFL